MSRNRPTKSFSISWSASWIENGAQLLTFVESLCQLANDWEMANEGENSSTRYQFFESRVDLRIRQKYANAKAMFKSSLRKVDRLWSWWNYNESLLDRMINSSCFSRKESIQCERGPEARYTERYLRILILFWWGHYFLRMRDTFPLLIPSDVWSCSFSLKNNCAPVLFNGLLLVCTDRSKWECQESRYWTTFSIVD